VGCERHAVGQRVGGGVWCVVCVRRQVRGVRGVRGVVCVCVGQACRVYLSGVPGMSGARCVRRAEQDLLVFEGQA